MLTQGFVQGMVLGMALLLTGCTPQAPEQTIDLPSEEAPYYYGDDGVLYYSDEYLGYVVELDKLEERFYTEFAYISEPAKELEDALLSGQLNTVLDYFVDSPGQDHLPALEAIVEEAAELKASSPIPMFKSTMEWFMMRLKQLQDYRIEYADTADEDFPPEVVGDIVSAGWAIINATDDWNAYRQAHYGDKEITKENYTPTNSSYLLGNS